MRLNPRVKITKIIGIIQYMKKGTIHMTILQNIANTFLNAIPGILAAIVVLILALLVAWLSKFIVTKILTATKLDQKLNRFTLEEQKPRSTVEYVGRLVFIIVFILFLPSVFARLGLDAVASPISSLVNTVVAYIPSLLAAALILFIGLFVARVIRDLLLPLLRKVGVDRFSQAPSADHEKAVAPIRLSSAIANVVYVLILIPIVIAALQTLRIEAISVPAVAMLNQIFTFIPQILMAIVLIAIGAFLARFIGNFLTQLLDSVGADRWLEDLMPVDVKPARLSVSKAIGRIVQIVILLFFIVEGLNVIQLEILQNIGSAVIAYLPNVLIAVVILFAATYLASWLESYIKTKLNRTAGIAGLAKVTVLVLAFFVIFDQLNIANATINVAFRYTLAALAIAFALSFGLGGRDFAKHALAKLSNKAEDVADDYNSETDRPKDDYTANDPFAEDADHLAHQAEENTGD